MHFKFLGVVFVILIIVIIIAAFIDESSRGYRVGVSPEEDNVSKKVGYSIFEEYDYSYPGVSRMEYKIRLIDSKVPDDNKISKLSSYLLKSHGNSYKEFDHKFLSCSI